MPELPSRADAREIEKAARAAMTLVPQLMRAEG